jgi:hypothetical protein
MVAKVDKYIEQRRALGWQLTVEARELARFAAYADKIGHQGPLTIELALGWARLAGNRSRLYQARRLETVGTFARHLANYEPGTAIPSRGLLGPAHQLVRPYIYSDYEIIRLMQEASQLSFMDGLRALTYRTLIGLLASTGIREKRHIYNTATVRIVTFAQTDFLEDFIIDLRISAAGLPR